MSNQIQELLNASRSLREKGNPEGAHLADDAYREAQNAHNHTLAIAAIQERIKYALYVNANYGVAQQLSLELLNIADPEAEPEAAAMACNSLGICKDVTGDYFASRNYYLQTINRLEPANNLTVNGKIILGDAYYNLNKLYDQIHTDGNTLDYVARAEKIYGEINYADGLSRLWNMRATQLPQNAPVEERLKLFEKAFSYFEPGKNTKARATCKANIGLCHCHMMQFDKGLEILKNALDDILKLNSPPTVAFIQFQIAEGLRLKGDYNTAINYLEQAEKILLEKGAKVYLNVVYREWASNLAAIGKFEEAYDKMIKFTGEVSDRAKFDRHSAVEEARLKFELEKKEHEAELLRIKNHEIELYNERLQNSIAELNQFAYVASHDLKEPLRMVTNYMQLIEKSFEGALNEDQLIYLRFANEGAQRMFSLIDSLLAFSRATIDTELHQVDLNLVIEEVMHIVLSDKTRVIKITYDKLPVLMGDSNQLIQLFQNLIANAIKYNNKNEVKIHLSYRAGSDTHTIAVTDNGIGIDEQHRIKVFDIFKRLHGRDSYSGTGIGLAICKKIVNRMGGKIWIEDGDLGGVAFVFTIPLAFPNIEAKA